MSGAKYDPILLGGMLRESDDGGSGGSGVQSVSSVSPEIQIDNTDPNNPIFSFINLPDGTVSVVLSVSSVNITNLAYNNGASGVGATLTKTSGTFTAANFGLTVLPAIGSRILLRGLTNQTWRGVYVYTSTTVLTRATDSDTTAELNSQYVRPTTQKVLYVQETANPVIGTNNIVYNSTPTVTSVTQGTTGTQAQYQILYWDSPTRQASRGTDDFKRLDNIKQFFVNGEVNQVLSYLSGFFRNVVLKNFLGLGMPGAGHYAGSTSGVGPTSDFAFSASVKHPSLGYLQQQGTSNTLFDSLSTYGGSSQDHTLTNKTTGGYGQISIGDTSTSIASTSGIGSGIHINLGYDEYSTIRKDSNPYFSTWSTAPSLNTNVTNGFGNDSPMSCVDIGGDLAWNDLYVVYDYELDSASFPYKKDGAITVDPSINGADIRITMPLAGDNLNRIIAITLLRNDGESGQNNYIARVDFSGSDYYNRTYGLVEIDGVTAPGQTKLYKSYYDNNIGSVVWKDFMPSTQLAMSGNIRHDGTAFVLPIGCEYAIYSNEDFGLSLGGSLEIENGYTKVGTKVVVQDTAGIAGTHHINIRATGSDIYYQGGVSAGAILLDKNRMTVVLEKYAPTKRIAYRIG